MRTRLHRSTLLGLLSSAALALTLSFTGSAAWGQTETKGKPAAAAAAADPREGVSTALAAFAKSFQARDAQALSQFWTEEGEYENDNGIYLQSRGDIAKAFGGFFERTPEITVSMQVASVRLIGRDTARASGVVTVRKGPAANATKADFEALVVREDGKWRLAKLSETSNEELSINDLAWLIGEWESTGGGRADVHTTYSWSPTKKFIHVDFTVKEKGLSLAGKQVIGLDPATKQFKSWTFGVDGAVGEANWSRDGDHWALEASGTLADGQPIRETNLLRRVGDDTFTWQSIQRFVNDEVFPDLPPVKVTRVKSAK